MFSDLPSDIILAIFEIDNLFVIGRCLNKYFNTLFTSRFERYKLECPISEYEIKNYIETKPKFYTTIENYNKFDINNPLKLIYNELLDGYVNTEFEYAFFWYFGDDKIKVIVPNITKNIMNPIKIYDIDIFSQYHIYIRRNCESISIKNLLLDKLNCWKYDNFLELMKCYYCLFGNLHQIKNYEIMNYKPIFENDISIIIYMKSNIPIMKDTLIEVINNL